MTWVRALLESYGAGAGVFTLLCEAASSSVSSRMRKTRPLPPSVTCSEPSSATSTRTLCTTRPASPSLRKPVFSACIQLGASTRKVTVPLPGCAPGMCTS